MTNKTNIYKDTFEFALHYWGRRPCVGALVILFITLATLADVFIPLYVGKMMDGLNDGSISEVLLASAIFIALFISFFIFRWSYFLIGIKLQTVAMSDIASDALENVQKFSTRWHGDAFAGSTIRKITRGMWAFDVLFSSVMTNIFPSILVTIGISALLVIMLPPVGIFTSIMSVLYLSASIFMAAKIQRPLYDKSANADTAVGGKISDIITGNTIVKAFGAEATEERRFSRVINLWELRAKKAWNIGNNCTFIGETLRSLMLIGMLTICIWMWSVGNASAGDVILTMSGYFVMSGYFANIGETINNLQKAISEMEDVVRFRLETPDLMDKKGAKDFVARDGEIKFEGVRFKYPNTNKVLFDGLDLNISAGEQVALVGHSGSGKSSFIKLIQRLYDVDGGCIVIDGQDISDVTQASLRKSIALVPQESALFHRSIAANIAYGKPDARRSEIIDAARKAYAHDFIKDLPQGYDTLVGERGVKLSGGERQRVAIARAILSDARILILDEATASLDSVSEHYIQLALKNLMRGRTCITVAHRLSTIRAADRILVMEKGKVIEEGSHVGLLGTEGSAYAKLHEMQAFFG